MTEAQTAYSKSIDVAKALMASAQHKQTELEKMEQDTTNAKTAFRTAFEFWKEMQPVSLTADYFTLAVTRANARYNATNQDELTRRLIYAVLDYLEYMATANNQNTDA